MFDIKRLLFTTPLLILIMAFSLTLFSRDNDVTSEYIEKYAKLDHLISVKDDKNFSPTAPYILHVFSQTCKWCKVDFQTLSKLNSKIPVYGLMHDAEDYNQDSINKLGFYKDILVDPSKKTFIHLGIRGFPTTFVIGKDNTIIYTLRGPIKKEDLTHDILPIFSKAD